MKSRRTQLIFTLATIILVAGFVLVPGEARADISSGLSNVTNHSTTSSLSPAALVGNFLLGYFGSTSSAPGAVASFVVKPIVDAVLEVLANWGLDISNLHFISFRCCIERCDDNHAQYGYPHGRVK